MNKTERHFLIEFYAASAMLELGMYCAAPYSPAAVVADPDGTVVLLPALLETIQTFVILTITGAGPAIVYDAMDDEDEDEDRDGAVSPSLLFEDGPCIEQQKLNLGLIFKIKAARMVRDKPAATVQDIMDGIVTMCKCGSKVEWVEYAPAGLLSGVLGVE